MSLIPKGSAAVIRNVIWNLLSSVVSTGVLQLCVHPLLARIYDGTDYGNILFLVGLMNVVILAVGNALGDIRLTEDGEYSREGIAGDFNLILILGGMICAAVMTLMYFLLRPQVPSAGIWILLTLPATCILGMLHSYLTALFRLKLIFRQSLTVNLFASAGYLVGVGLAWLTGLWTLPFLLGHLLAVLCQTRLTRFYREPFAWTARRGTTGKKYGTLSFSYLLKSSMTYVDRFVITPMLGADMLSVYTVAATFGKLAAIAIQPVANVALGYYAQKDFRMTLKKYWVTNLVTAGFGAVVYLAAVVLSKPFIAILYPGYLDTAADFVVLANLASVLTAVCAMIQPAVLKFASVAWQVVIQLCHGVLTVVLSLVFIGSGGLMGFCWASVIAGVCKLAIMLYVGHRGVRKLS